VRAAACEACIECYRRVGRRLERLALGLVAPPGRPVK